MGSIMARKHIPLFTLLVCLLSLVPAAQPVRAQAGSASDLINEVNALRASYGLSPLQVNSALMSSSQFHSDYQASINSVTHSGPGGSRPRDRAAAFGYGGGAAIFVSENIAGGTDLSVQTTVHSFWADDLHMNTMINPQYKDIGAGVSISNGMVYYTIDVGYTAGSPGSGTDTGTNQTPLPGAVPTRMEFDPAQYVFGIQTVTPNPDGSVTHLVRQGQAPLMIANAYGIKLEDLMRWNNLPANPVIWSGDKLVVRPSNTPTPAPTSTRTPVPPTITRTPTRTPVPPTATVTPTITPTRPLLPPLTGDTRQTVGMVIVGMSVMGLLLVALGSIKKR